MWLLILWSGAARNSACCRALGAQQHDLLALILRQGLAPVIVGLLGGTAAALLGGSIVQALLYEIKPFDPPTFAVVIAVVAIVAVIGCFIPARRAMRVDPMVALRYE